MSYVHLSLANVIDSAEVGRPNELTLRNGGGTRLWSDYITDAELAECGWFKVVAVARPADTPTQVFERSLIVVSGVPTEKWTARNRTAAELADITRAANSAALTDLAAVTTAMANLKAFLTDADVQAVLDVANTTALTTQQTNRALKAMIRQQRRDANFDLRLARLVLSGANPTLLDDISDTTGAG